MVGVRTLHMRGGPIRDRQQLLDAGFCIAALDTGIPLPERFLDDTGHAFPGSAGDRLREPMGFGVLDVEAQGLLLFVEGED